jgi:hypothetical protein
LLHQPVGGWGGKAVLFIGANGLAMVPEVFEAAIRHAPIIYHGPGEECLPTNVDWFLARTRLGFLDHTGPTAQSELLVERPTQADLVSQRKDTPHGIISSNGTRSQRKRLTFFLEDVATEHRTGSLDPGEWTTYLHAYPNDIGGITLQYWRFYAYNLGLVLDASPFGLPNSLNGQIGSHGGDWEGIHIVLDGSYTPQRLRCLRHRDILDRRWNEVEIEADTHPRIYAGRGGHPSDLSGTRTGVRQETWGRDRGATVTFPGATPVPAGALLDVGTKNAPANGQVFVQYSGLWGSPSTFPLPGSDLHYTGSGYWGPAYNETEIRPDGFITAWGAGARAPNEVFDGVREYFPAAICP